MELFVADKIIQMLFFNALRSINEIEFILIVVAETSKLKPIKPKTIKQSATCEPNSLNTLKDSDK